MKGIGCFAGILLLALAPVSAVADMTPYTIGDMTIEYGDIQIGNSWSFAASAGGIGSYDFIAVRIASGNDLFESPAIRNISNSSWDMVLDTPTLVSFGGPAVASLSWRTYFQGDLPMSGPLQLDWAMFYNEQLTAWTHWHIAADGSLQKWWLRSADGWQPTFAQVVPVPAAVLIDAPRPGRGGSEVAQVHVKAS